MTTTAPSIPLQHEDRRRRIHHAVEHAAHLVPAQGPIGVFIHHNTLHAFQNLPFEKAVCEASELYRTEPFLKEDAYRDHLREKRIRIEDIEAVLDREITEPILPGRLDRRTLRKKLLVVGQRRFEPATIRWQMEETDLLRIPRAGAAPAELQELFKVCQGLVEVPHCTPCPALRPRDVLLTARGIDPDEIIHPVLIRLCGAFLDQGMAYWPMPNREQGFLKCVRSLLSQWLVVFPEYLQDLGKEFRRQAEAALEADGVVLSMLERFGVSEADWDRTIQAELLALPGWAGMMYRLEVEPELAPHVPVPCSLMDYLAVRLTIEAVATARIMGTKGLSVLMRSPTLAERPAQFDDALRQRFVANDHSRPNGVQKLLTAHDPVCMLGKQHQHLHRLRLDAYRLTPSPKFVRGTVRPPFADPNSRLRYCAGVDSKLGTLQATGSDSTTR